jgi:hypothetical protein
VELSADGATLLDLISGTKHTLLLFDGTAATEQGYETLSTVANQVRDRDGDDVDVHVVVPFADKPAALDWDGPLLHDVDLEVHSHFGARSESLYLIRPDGYVGYRSQPLDAAHLTEYLEGLFIR